MTMNLTNGALTATIDRVLGVRALITADGHALQLANDSFCVDVAFPSLQWTANLRSPASDPDGIRDSSCKYSSDTRPSARELVLHWTCAGPPHQPAYELPLFLHVSATYSLPESADTAALFVSKALSVASSRPFSAKYGTFTVTHVAPFGAGLIVDAASARIQINPHGQSGSQIAAFFRGGSSDRGEHSRRGGFVSVANPFGVHTMARADGDPAALAMLGGGSQHAMRLSASFAPHHTHRPPAEYTSAAAWSPANGPPATIEGMSGGVYVAEPALLGLTRLTRYEYADGLNTGERAAFVACVET